MPTNSHLKDVVVAVLESVSSTASCVPKTPIRILRSSCEGVNRRLHLHTIPGNNILEPKIFDNREYYIWVGTVRVDSLGRYVAEQCP